MGALILVLAVLIEVAFATYCIVTTSSQRMVRGFVRVGAFAAFVIFALVSVIEWSFRWYGLAALLFVWAALGIRTLLQGRGISGKYGPVRTAFKAIATLAIVFIALIPALILPQHRPPKVTGQHAVATATYTFTDEGRVETFNNTGEKRKINVEFWYPADADGRYPIVVFSHGAFGVKASNTSTYTELASNGYVVCSIDHPYHSFFTSGEDGKMTAIDPSFMQEVTDANKGVYDGAAELKIYRKWMGVRTADIGLALEKIVERSAESGADGAYRRIDTTRIGLIGHSMGGAASAQVGRERNDIDAVINLDGDLLGEYLDYVDGRVVVNDAVYPVPLLTIYSDDMVQLIANITDPNVVIPGSRIAATAPTAYEIHIAGTDHMSLTDLPLVSPFLVSMIGNPKGLVHQNRVDEYYAIETMNAKVLEFFDSFLKGKGTFTSGTSAP